MTYYKDSIRQIDAEERNLNRSLACIKNDLTRVEHDKHCPSCARAHASGEFGGAAHTKSSIRLRFLVEKPRKSKSSDLFDLDFILVYTVRGVTWHVRYDMNVTTKDTPALSLSYYALVTQDTGEDWSGVSLSVSNGSSKLGVAPSDLPVFPLVWASGAKKKSSKFWSKSKRSTFVFKWLY